MLFSRQILNGSQDYFSLFNILIFINFFKYLWNHWDPCPRIFDTYYFSYSWGELSHVTHITTQKSKSHGDYPKQFKKRLLSAVFLMPYPEQTRICQWPGILTNHHLLWLPMWQLKFLLHRVWTSPLIKVVGIKAGIISIRLIRGLR